MSLFDSIVNVLIKKKGKATGPVAVVPAQPKRKAGRPKKRVKVVPITKMIPSEPSAADIPKNKVCCATNNEHTCIAIEMINRVIQMVEDFEVNVKRIEDNKSIDPAFKNDIQHYINKNIVTAIWALAPAFPYIPKYNRISDFKSVYKKAVLKRAPGILVSKRHI